MAHIVSAQNRRAEAGKGLGSEASPTYRVELPAGEQGYKVRPCLKKKKIQMVDLGAYLRGLTCLLSMWKALDSIKALKTIWKQKQQTNKPKNHTQLGPERALSGQELLLFWQKTWILVPAPGSGKLTPLTPVSENLTTLLWGHSYPFTYFTSHFPATYTQLKINLWKQNKQKGDQHNTLSVVAYVSQTGRWERGGPGVQHNPYLLEPAWATSLKITKSTKQKSQVYDSHQ